MKVAGIEIEVVRKKIKHTHLSVFPPDARVHVSAPDDLSDDDLKSFIISKIPWIKRQVKIVRSQPRQTRREYVSGENVYLLGKRYRLTIKNSDDEVSVKRAGSRIVMEGRGLGARAAREAKIMSWYKDELKLALERILPRCAEAAKEEDVTFGIRKMRNVWGTCNAKKRHIWFNIVLARVPLLCIEYVVKHELVHLTVPNHSLLFERKMTECLPRWREIRKELNEFMAWPLI